MATEDALDDLIAACRAAPASAALIRALMAEAMAGESAGAAFVYLSEADPAAFDAELRRKVADFLGEGGRDEAARHWRPEALRAVGGLEGTGGVVVDLGQRRERGAEFAEPSGQERIDFADIGGLEDVKQQIRRRIIAPLEKPGLFSAFKRRAGGGLLFYGPPGCGKTMLARAAAGEAKVSFLTVRIPDILDRWLGESEKHIAAAFAEAKARKPAILFFDEIEALASRRRGGDHDHTSSMVSTFLSEFDGLAASSDAMLVIAATNVPWMIDTAFRRPGRFDRVLFVPPPDRTARAAILGILLAGRPTTGDLDPGAIAARTSGFSGADLENLVDTAADRAIAASLETGGEVPIDQRHLLGALGEIKPTTIEWLTTARNYARYANEGGQYDEVMDFLRRHGKS
jgi:AAA+ superfamily predicted ATPase